MLTGPAPSLRSQKALIAILIIYLSLLLASKVAGLVANFHPQFVIGKYLVLASHFCGLCIVVYLLAKKLAVSQRWPAILLVLGALQVGLETCLSIHGTKTLLTQVKPFAIVVVLYELISIGTIAAAGGTLCSVWRHPVTCWWKVVFLERVRMLMFVLGISLLLQTVGTLLQTLYPAGAGDILLIGTAKYVFFGLEITALLILLFVLVVLAGLDREPHCPVCRYCIDNQTLTCTECGWTFH